MKKGIIIFSLLAITILSIFAFIPHKKGGGFNSDFDAYRASLDNFVLVIVSHGDTATALSDLDSKINTINAYPDFEANFNSYKNQWPPYAQAACIAGCAKWFDDCYMSHGGAAAWDFCAGAYENCISHCNGH